jgi:hypothetical protein
MVTEAVHQTVLDFLHSVNTAKRKASRCLCGALMEYQHGTFFYEGESWEVELSVCLKCHPIRHVAAHAA